MSANVDTGAIPKEEAEKLVNELLQRDRPNDLFRMLVDEARKDPDSFQAFVELFASMVPEIKQHRFVKQYERLTLKNARDAWIPDNEE